MFEHLTPKAKGAAEALEIALMESPPSIEFVAGKSKALLPALGETPWRPIDEAPKDGTEFLGYFSNGEQHVVYIDCGECWRLFDGIWLMPTHFMPLPAPPAEAQP